MNTQYFHDLVKGRYGRKIAYSNAEQITADNIVNVVGNCIGAFYFNKPIIRYLWHYYKGDQPVLYRTKIQNADITNKVSENHAMRLFNSRSVRLTVSQFSLSAEKTMT